MPPSADIVAMGSNPHADAGADWETEMQMGSDGQEYLAFAPKSAADKRRDEALYGKYRDALEEKDN